MTEMHWPVVDTAAGADIHVVNRAVSTASPEQVWAWIVRPDRWSEIYPAPTASVTSPGHGRASAPVYIGLRNDQIPRATPRCASSQQLGGSLGTAIFAVILQHQIAHPSGAADGHAAIAAAFITTVWWALGVVPSHVVRPGLLGGWLVSKPPVPRRTPDEAAR